MKVRFQVVRSAALLLCAAGAMVSAGCTMPPAPPPGSTTPPPPPPPATGSCSSSSAALTCSSLTVGGVQRKFFTHQSTAAAPAGGRPLVMFFHGDGGTGNTNWASLYAQTDLDGAVVVQPDGSNNIVPANENGAWSFYMNGSAPDDVQFTKTIMDGIINGSMLPGANINPKRIYVMGVSRGGFMVDTLMVDARTAPYFPAGVNLFGNFFCEDGDNVCESRVDNGGFRTQNILHIHGDADGAVPPPATVPNPVTSTISWPWPMAQFADANGCSGDFAYSATLPAMSGKPTYLYKPAGACAKDFQLVLVKGAGHGVSNWESYSWNYVKGKAKP